MRELAVAIRGRVEAGVGVQSIKNEAGHRFDGCIQFDLAMGGSEGMMAAVCGY